MDNITMVQIEMVKTNKEKRTVEVGDEIKIKAVVKDEISGVRSVSISFKNPSGSRTQHVLLNHDKNNGLWAGSYIIKPTDEDGQYSEFFINMVDNAGNKNYGWSILDEFTDKMIFTVSNHLGEDIIPPKIIYAEINPKVININETLHISMEIEDDLSGVKSASISIKNPSGSRTENIILQKNTSSNIWVGDYVVNEWDENGLYSEFFLNMIDNAGNKIYGWDLLKEFKSKLEYTVENNQGGDINPPNVLFADITPKIINVSDNILIKLKISDDKSGTKSVSIGFRNPSKRRTQNITLAYDAISEFWMGNYTAKDTDEGGIYNDFFVSLTDNAGNRIYGWDLIANYHENLIFTIRNKNGDIEPPNVKNVIIS